MRDAKERVTAAYGRTTETAERAYREARGWAQENPGTAAVRAQVGAHPVRTVAMAAVAGLLLGKLLGRR